MEIGCLGIGDRACIGISSRRAGLSHRLAARSRICRVRKTSALVDHTHRFPDWNRGRVILPWLRHRTVADGWSRTLLVNHNFAGGFSFAHWSGGAANVLIALAAGAILTGFYLWRRDLWRT